MSDKDKKTQKLEELSAAYDEYVDQKFQSIDEEAEAAAAAQREGKSVKDEGILTLRGVNKYSRPSTPCSSTSGSRHSSSSPPPTPQPRKMHDPLAGEEGANANKHGNMQGQTSGQGTQTQPPGGTGAPATPEVQASAPIKVMPSDASVREFTSTEDDYSAKDFIKLCENVMHNSSVTTDVDKIAFVSARIKPGSKAFKRMRVSALTESITRGNYEGFRQGFLKIFRENVKHNLVKGVHLAVERVLAGVDAQDIDEAQINANYVSEDLVNCLKDNT